MERTRILFLAANPDATTPLHAGREVRRIRERLAGAVYGGSVEIVERWAVRPGDLQPALRDVRPHIVHFSGHGNEQCELMLEGEGGSPQPMGQRVLGELFRLRGEGVRLVVLSACHSLPQAETIAEHVECAVGMRRSIGSEAATELSAALYHAIASGDSIQRAFESARLHLEATGIPEHRTPQLVVRRDGVDTGRIVFTGPAQRSDVAPALGAAMAGSQGAGDRLGGHQAGAPAPLLEFSSITLDRRETCWRLVPDRQATSPFSAHCRYYLQLDGSAAAMADPRSAADLPFDVTVLNLASRPLTLTHVGVELVELCPSSDWLTSEHLLLSTPRSIPRARKVKKRDAYIIEGHDIFRLLRGQWMEALRRGGAHNERIGEPAPVTSLTGAGAASCGARASVVPVGKTVWSELDDPIHLDSSAPYRFGMIVRRAQEYFPRHLILRLATRTQLGDHHSSAVETSISL
jgi:hypothetical protein